MSVALEETKAGNLREDIFVTRTLGDLKEKQKSSRIVEFYDTGFVKLTVNTSKLYLDLLTGFRVEQKIRLSLKWRQVFFLNEL